MYLMIKTSYYNKLKVIILSHLKTHIQNININYPLRQKVMQYICYKIYHLYYIIIIQVDFCVMVVNK
jgi:hypothetical protein